MKDNSLQTFFDREKKQTKVKICLRNFLINSASSATIRELQRLRVQIAGTGYFGLLPRVRMSENLSAQLLEETELKLFGKIYTYFNNLEDQYPLTSFY